MRFTPHRRRLAILLFTTMCWESGYASWLFEQWRSNLLKDERSGEEELFAYEGGLRAFVEFLNQRRRLSPKFAIFRQRPRRVSRSRWPCNGMMDSRKAFTVTPTISRSETAVHTGGFSRRPHPLLK